MPMRVGRDSLRWGCGHGGFSARSAFRAPWRDGFCCAANRLIAFPSEVILHMSSPISAVLARSLETLDALLFRDVNKDMNRRLLRLFGRDAAVFFVDGMCSGEYLQRFVLLPAQTVAESSPSRPLEQAIPLALPVTEVETVSDYEQLIGGLMDGKAVLLADGMAAALCIDIRAYVRRSISTPLNENVVLGPHEGFNESLRDNITLLRRIFHTPQLIGEMTTVGQESPVNLCVLYLQQVVSPVSLSRVRERLQGLNCDHLLSIGALEQLMEDHPFSLLPQCLLTERPDRAASFLLEGQIVILMDGAPQALVMPINFLHAFHTSEDTSLRWPYGSFLRIVRLTGALLTLLLPGLFVALVIFHPATLPVALLTSILESQAAVPLSIPVETFLMLFMFNLINEAGTRVPGIVGTSLGTVSGLILGQAAVEANLIHPLLIIVVAASSLGSYALPDYELSLAFRIGQLLFLAAGCIAGIYGMVALTLIVLARLCALTSLGAPYLAPLSPRRPSNPDLLLRLPLWRQRLRTYLASPAAMDRVRGPMRRWNRS